MNTHNFRVGWRIFKWYILQGLSFSEILGGSPIWVGAVHTATARHGVTRKRSTKRLKHTGSFLRRNLNRPLSTSRWKGTITEKFTNCLNFHVKNPHSLIHTFPKSSTHFKFAISLTPILPPYWKLSLSPQILLHNFCKILSYSLKVKNPIRKIAKK